GWVRAVWPVRWNLQPMLLALRFVVSFGSLLIPTTAMSLTLTVLMSDPILRRSYFGRALGFLSGANTLGAVAGALVGEVYLIGAFGLRGTSVAAGLASCLAATLALLVAKKDGVVAEFVSERVFPLRFAANYRPPWRL